MKNKNKSKFLPVSLTMLTVLVLVIVFHATTVSRADQKPQEQLQTTYTVETVNDNHFDTTESSSETGETHYELEEEFSNQNVTIEKVEY